MIRRYAIGFFVVMLAAQGRGSVVPRHVSPGSMNSDAREQFQMSMDANARLWDENLKLVHSPEYVAGRRYPGSYLEDFHYFEKCCEKVRETSSYALSLLFRDAPGDRQRAVEALDAVLKEQYVTPGVRWFGTFKRTPEEPDPIPSAVMWRDYDPNWREFIGTNLAMILVEYPDRISPELSQRLYRAIDLAIEGEMAEGRLVPSYTNPALMYGALWDFAATHDKRADWKKQSQDWIESVYDLFKKYNSFYEYNSPTYYGVDLFALALWRDYGSTEHIRAMGGEMESGLWEDIAAFYQPELHNLAGPYDRSYGMDTETPGGGGGGGVVELMRYAVDEQGVPLASHAKRTGAGFSCPMAILGTRIPQDALMKLQSFQGEHLVRRQISDQRIATAWIGKHVIFGGEATSKARDVGKKSQFHPVTIQWRTPSGEIGWVQVVQSPMIDATADKQGLTISTTGTIRLRIHAKGLVAAQVSQNAWELPGLHVAVTSDPHGVFSLEKADDALNEYFKVTDNMIDLVYPGITQMRLDIKADADR
jgi:hypothetical protein